MANAVDHQQADMRAKQEPEFSLSCHPFTRQFSQAAHALLTSCTRQEVLGYFAHFDPKTQENLYNIYAHVVAQIRENVVAEFGSICREHRVIEVLDHVSDTTELGDHIHPEKVAKEVAVGRKFRERDEMKRQLEQAIEDNKILAAKVEVFRLEMEKARGPGGVSDLIEKVSTAICALETV